MRYLDIFYSLEIGDGAADFEQPVVGAGGEAKLAADIERIFPVTVSIRTAQSITFMRLASNIVASLNSMLVFFSTVGACVGTMSVEAPVLRRFGDVCCTSAKII